MNIELRNVKLAKTLSEETPAYTAALYLDGKKVADLSNHGFGGCDNVRWTDEAAEAKVAAHFKALPKIKSHGMELTQDLEMWAHGEVWRQDDVKRNKALGQRKIVGVLPSGDMVSWKAKPAQITPDFRARTLAKYPGLRFMHELSDAEVRALVDAEYAKQGE